MEQTQLSISCAIHIIMVQEQSTKLQQTQKYKIITHQP